MNYFISCIHIGRKLGEGAGNGAGPDPCHQVNLHTPEDPTGDPKEMKTKG